MLSTSASSVSVVDCCFSHGNHQADRNMLSRQMTKYGSAVCCRCDFVVNFMSTKAAIRQGLVSSSSTFAKPKGLRPTETRATHLNASHKVPLRLEGIQGPISTPLTLRESTRLLASAEKQVNDGFFQQGVQDFHLFTDLHHQKRAEISPLEGKLEEGACPQGVQGYEKTDADDEDGCIYFFTWLDTCSQYGQVNCDQQLEGIQSGRPTLRQILAEQEARITEIADAYRKFSQEYPSAQGESFQGAQDEFHLPDINMPCPQGVQGDDCVGFKLWLENCHHFGLHECLEQLQGFQSGRVTLAEIFEEQDAIIREVVRKYRQKRI